MLVWPDLCFIFTEVVFKKWVWIAFDPGISAEPSTWTTGQRQIIRISL